MMLRLSSAMTFFSTSDRLEIGDVPFISHLVKPNRFEALEYYRRVASTWQLHINLYEEVNSVKKQEESFKVNTPKNSYLANNIIVATGFYDYPFLLNIEGEDLPKEKHYYDEPHPYFGQKIVVIGAANSAVDVALETIQVLGGNGYINEYASGRLLRDAKLYDIGAGTNEIRLMLIGRELYNEAKIN